MLAFSWRERAAALSAVTDEVRGALMCGIAGLRHLDGRAVDPHALEEMAAVLLHRGPDEQSVVADGAVGFAHTRLSIIDVGGSHQPMDSADGRWTLVFNGEIFNYRELRRTLDYPFRHRG